MHEATITHLADLRARGATYAEARTSVAGLERLTRGAYASTSGLSAEERHLLRARAVVRGVCGVVSSHVTAAVCWGLPVRAGDLTKVHLSPRESRTCKPKHGPGYHMHTHRVRAHELTLFDDLPATSVLRTVLDCARLLDRDWGVVIADNALHRRLVTTDELGSEASGVHRLKGAQRARALPMATSALAESPGESLLRLRLARMGLRAEEQVEMPWVPGSPRVDFLIEGWLVVEFDGRRKYEIDGDPAAAHWAEKLRHDRLTEEGKTVIHVTWKDLWDEPALARRIHRVHDRGRRST